MFETYLEVTLAMSIVIAFVFIVSKFLNEKYKVKWRYFVWLIIAFRLLLPINYKSVYSLINIKTSDPRIRCECVF